MKLDTSGRAAVEGLGRQEFQYDPNKPVSGEGAWRVVKPGEYKGGMSVGNGKLLRLSVATDNESKDGQDDEKRDNDALSHFPSGHDSQSHSSTWIMNPSSDAKGTYLYFLIGDPDVREMCILRKEKGIR
ncbi:hypothetical protein [Streptomyces sp. NPDC093097]|uniref:hypothetical protein n=1 Tax=Streptomyces sp. NPDC093097 TaxID=3366027 RepID=UPI0037F6FE9F